MAIQVRLNSIKTCHHIGSPVKSMIDQCRTRPAGLPHPDSRIIAKICLPFDKFDVAFFQPFAARHQQFAIDASPLLGWGDGAKNSPSNFEAILSLVSWRQTKCHITANITIVIDEHEIYISPHPVCKPASVGLSYDGVVEGEFGTKPVDVETLPRETQFCDIG